ncbi:hypothetical protein [Mucilaginibacter polytrichastri]|uniref:Uncharacterized protein n=1 Tax=Mucilaginibacter polytrichastri TaxID=1302689 RepID=A0A1Q5ZVX2_9SPHI|nr:hypothetical protein [Mucilaginibacter polytrichastri]OKS85909.1 hypothetical protein RG47T_1355 [Mucilaginibacter polytrichastri]SFS60646.1 hypothetical protein SAMN04487890_102227 [Mucilaginibacter polytrichastri]
MFFHHLPNFSPYSGHIYDALRVPFICKKDGNFGRDDKRFDLMDREGYLPFREMIRGDTAYFISDADLFDFLSIKESTINSYDIHGCPGWNLEMKERFTEQFISGYDEGIVDFERNLGITYTALPHEQQLPYLRTYCLYCLDFLFFEGDLNEALFYNLGYLQANVYRGFVEINHLLALSPDTGSAIRMHFESYYKGKEIVRRNKPTEEKREEPEAKLTPAIAEETVSQRVTTAPERIELLCDIEEIKKLWLVLTAPIKTKNGSEAAVFSTAELTGFLGSVFSSGAFPNAFKAHQPQAPMLTSKGDMRNVLNALMYASYNINREYNRSTNLVHYAAILKHHFSVFAGSGINSIKSVMATYSPKGIAILKGSSTDNPHIEEMLSILKKHKLLH